MIESSSLSIAMFSSVRTNYECKYILRYDTKKTLWSWKESSGNARFASSQSSISCLFALIVYSYSHTKQCFQNEVRFLELFVQNESILQNLKNLYAHCSQQCLRYTKIFISRIILKISKSFCTRIHQFKIRFKSFINWFETRLVRKTLHDSSNDVFQLYIRDQRSGKYSKSSMDFPCFIAVENFTFKFESSNPSDTSSLWWV